MRHLSLLSLGFITFLSSQALAQEEPIAPSPIFISPYTQATQTYQSRVPLITQPQRTQNYTAPGRYSYSEKDQPVFERHGDVFDNPNSPFMRSANEEYFKDDQTGKTYNQYDYMALLYKRGETGELNQILSNVQRNGVFDPQKYKSVMAAAKAEKMGTQTNPQASGGTFGTPIGKARIVRTQKSNNQNALPQRIHQGYDDETENTTKSQSRNGGNAPIFLRY